MVENKAKKNGENRNGKTTCVYKCHQSSAMLDDKIQLCRIGCHEHGEKDRELKKLSFSIWKSEKSVCVCVTARRICKRGFYFTIDYDASIVKWYQQMRNFWVWFANASELHRDYTFLLKLKSNLLRSQASEWQQQHHHQEKETIKFVLNWRFASKNSYLINMLTRFMGNIQTHNIWSLSTSICRIWH